MSDPLPLVTPPPPRPLQPLPWVRSGAALLRDPTAFFARCRRELGDTFVVDAFGNRLLCLFSPAGVHNLWALPEREASKGVADFALLSHKVPIELFAGRRTRPHDLFSRDDVAVYLGNVEHAVAEQLDELGSSGEIELFALTRRFSHRVGLASWGGLTGEASRFLDPLARALDRLDSSESFVHPHRGLLTVALRKRAERRALATLEATYRELLALRRTRRPAAPDLFDRICHAWDDTAPPDREIGIARDVVLVHMGSQSNLFAANAWTLIHLLQRPDLLAAVRAGDAALLERCAHESIRLRQRSIVLRKVLREVEISDETHTYRVAPGAFIATTMAITNTTAATGLDGFDPDHFEGARFKRRSELAAPELVTTFGHGRHSCPAMTFSIASIRSFTSALLDRFELEPRFRDPQPLRRQIGGVARADRPCRVRYRLRA
jgi:cytochrome P450